MTAGRWTFALRALLLMLCLLCGAWLDPFRDEVKQGNEEFGNKKYNAAKTHYHRAEKYAPGEEAKKKLAFNTGDADYMSELHDDAIAGFEQALKSDDKDVQKKAFFNIGNALVKQGKYDEAVQSYINALNIDPGYEKAKKNIEYLLMKKDKDKEKQDGKDGRGKDDRDGKGNKDKEGGKQQDRKNSRAGKEGASGLNRAQVRNLLDSMKQSPVRRYKGKGDERRNLEKPW